MASKSLEINDFFGLVVGIASDFQPNWTILSAVLSNFSLDNSFIVTTSNFPFNLATSSNTFFIIVGVSSSNFKKTVPDVVEKYLKLILSNNINCKISSILAKTIS